MLPFPSDTELPPPGELEQFWTFPPLYLVVLGAVPLLLLRRWFIALLRIAFPFPAGKC